MSRHSIITCPDCQHTAPVHEFLCDRDGLAFVHGCLACDLVVIRDGLSVIGYIDVTTPDPTAPIRRQLERIEGWFTTSVRHHPPSPQAIAGNQANLVRLIDNLEPLPPGKQGDKLAARIATLQLQLADVADVAQEWDFQDDAIEWNSYGNCLLTVPTDDPRFQRDVDQVTRPAVIRYAAALIGDGNGQADRLKALSTRLRLLENPKYAPRTHKQLADELHVPINAVAIVREILSGTSEMSQWALGLYDNDALGAARQLASSRCGTDPAVYDSITPEFVETIKMGAIVSCVPAH